MCAVKVSRRIGDRVKRKIKIDRHINIISYFAQTFSF
jgi:hypothetical protein